ncbi:hypothetical protein TNCV_5021221 [Trichonephila clavipes]|nr:hypothetical protein TNCV_5021221 [Trichonephila clavipes]
MFKNTGRLTDRISSDGYSCYQVHFRNEMRVVNRETERSMLHQLLMHKSERLMIRLPPCWTSFPIQPNSKTFISVGKVVDEVDFYQLGVHTKIHIYRTLSMSEMRKSYVPKLRAHIQHPLLLSVHHFLCNYGSSPCSLPPFQVCTPNSGTPCIYLC